MTTAIEMPTWSHGELNRISGLNLPPSVQALVQRHTELFAQWASASTASAAAATARDRAQVVDQENRAASIARNHPVPKATLPAATKAATEAHERAGDLVRAVIIVEGEIPSAVQAHQRDLLAQVDNADADARATIRDSLQTIRDALMTLAHNALLRPTIAAPFDARSWRPSWPAPTLSGEVVAALDALGIYGGVRPAPTVIVPGPERTPGGVKIFDSQSGPDGSVELDEIDYPSLSINTG